jgi:hypothetical protein
MSLGRTETALGAFYRRLAYRVGKAKAITATARKLVILVYRTLSARCAIGSECPSMVCYVTLLATKEGVTASGYRSCCLL